jgi:hypothetical protein
MQEQIITVLSHVLAIFIACGILCYPFKRLWNEYLVPAFTVINEITVLQAYWLLIILTVF